MIRVLVVIALAVGAHIHSGGTTMAEGLLRADGHLLKWRSQAPGAVTVISYAVLTGDFTVSGDKRTLSPDNCGAMHAFADIIAKSPDVSVDAAKQELKAAFAAWEGAAPSDLCRGRRCEPREHHHRSGALARRQGVCQSKFSYRSGPDACRKRPGQYGP